MAKKREIPTIIVKHGRCEEYRKCSDKKITTNKASLGTWILDDIFDRSSEPQSEIKEIEHLRV